MPSVHRSDDRVPALLATLNTDGATPTPVKATTATNALRISIGTTGTNNGPSETVFDDNHVPALVAVSSVDGVTPVIVYADSNGNLLVQNT